MKSENLIIYHFKDTIGEKMMIPEKESCNTDSTAESSGSEGDPTAVRASKKKLVKVRANSLSAEQVQKAMRKRPEASSTSLDSTLKKLHSSQSTLRDARSEVSRRSTRSSSTGPRRQISGTQESRRRAIDRRRSKSPGNRNRSVSRDRRKQRSEGKDEKRTENQALPARSISTVPMKSVNSDLARFSLGNDELAPTAKRGILRTKSTSCVTRKSLLEDSQSTGKTKNTDGTDLNTNLPSLSLSDTHNFSRKETVTEMVLKSGIITQIQLEELVAAGFLFIKV